jgi:methylated-DNA-protein-cysteine methyltransferase related protein
MAKRTRDDDDDEKKFLSDSYRRITEVVTKIPRGKVMTYGQVAEAAGLGRAARLVGYAMHAIGSRMPWQRVLGARRKGVAQVSIKDPIGGTEQRMRLEREGVVFSASGGVELARFGHAPQRRQRTRK